MSGASDLAITQDINKACMDSGRRSSFALIRIQIAMQSLCSRRTSLSDHENVDIIALAATRLFQRTQWNHRDFSNPPNKVVVVLGVTDRHRHDWCILADANIFLPDRVMQECHRRQIDCPKI